MPTDESYCVLSQNSPTRRALTMFADKWTVLVIFALKTETKRLSRMQREIEGITQKMLVQTLRRMEENGLVTRTVHPVLPPHVDYELTPLGTSLLPLLSDLFRWATENLEPPFTEAGKSGHGHESDTEV